MTELFRMNEYGDIWQEPTLFDQARDDIESGNVWPDELDLYWCEKCGAVLSPDDPDCDHD